MCKNTLPDLAVVSVANKLNVSAHVASPTLSDAPCLVGKLEGEGQWVSNTEADSEVHQTLPEDWGSWRAS